MSSNQKMEASVALPGANDRVRCADFTRQAAVDPGGTAIRADLLVIAETPGAWPKPVFDHELLSGVNEMAAGAPQPTRVLAAVPGSRSESTETLEVVAYRRDPENSGRDERHAWRTSADSLRATIEAVLGGREPVDADRSETPGASPEVWICTQGSHDVCCGSDGARLAVAMESRRHDLVVRRVSHTGGHRFAPTAVVMPEGRMFAYLTDDLVEAIVDRTSAPVDLADKCRGWWGAGQGAAQVAERAVWAEQGWGWIGGEVELLSSEAGVDKFKVSGNSTTGLRSFDVEVAVLREVPTIACRELGGLPAKTGREYCVTSLRQR